MLSLISTSFQNNLRDVTRLVNFDRDVLDLVIASIEELHLRLKDKHASDQMNGGRLLHIVRTIRNNDSLRNRYDIIFNQAVVLLVSYFASTLGDIFRYAISAKLQSDERSHLLDEELKLTFREIRERGWNLEEAAPDLLIAKRDLTFQDMGATHRAFEHYVGVTLPRDALVNNVIAAQACRHVIVHAGAVISERLVKQVAAAVPRELKPSLKIGEKIKFSPEEIEAVIVNMRGYVDRLVIAVQGALGEG